MYESLLAQNTEKWEIGINIITDDTTWMNI